MTLREAKAKVLALRSEGYPAKIVKIGNSFEVKQ